MTPARAETADQRARQSTPLRARSQRNENCLSDKRKPRREAEWSEFRSPRRRLPKDLNGYAGIRGRREIYAAHQDRLLVVDISAVRSLTSIRHRPRRCEGWRSFAYFSVTTFITPRRKRGKR